jgi:hypothetical protein
LLPGSKKDTCQHGDPGAGKSNSPGDAQYCPSRNYTAKTMPRGKINDL